MTAWDERGECNGPRDCTGTERGCAACDPRPPGYCGRCGNAMSSSEQLSVMRITGETDYPRNCFSCSAW